MAFATHALCLLFALCILQGCKLFGFDDDKPGTSGPTPRGYFRIVSPAPGDVLNFDSTHTILWAPSDSVLAGSVRISVFKGDKFLFNLINSASNSGAYIWRPSTHSASSGYRLGSGSDYQLRIAATADTGQWDMSGAFSLRSLYQGFIAVTSPTGSTQVKMDSSLAIRWEGTGTIGSYLGIQLFKDTLLLTTLTSTAQPTGYYLWSSLNAYLTSYGSGNDYRIRVFSISDPSISGTSPAFSVSSAYTGDFTVLSPESGDTLTAGLTSTLAWTSTGNPGSSVRITLWRDSVQASTISSSAVLSGSMNFTPSVSLVTSSRYRIRLTSTSDPSLFAFSDYFHIKGMDPDTYENDDSLHIAKTISVDGKAQQRTLTTSDLDWVEFSASMGKKYWVSARSATVSMYLYVYDSTGRLITSNSGNTTVQTTLSPTRAGKYYARISSYSGYGPYALSITEYDSASAPFTITFASPTDQSTWAAGTTYPIQYSPDTTFFGPYVSLALYQDSTLLQNIASGVNNSGSYSWSIPASLFSSDRYRIRISNYSNTSIFAFSSHFSISGVTPDSFETDNTLASAKLLPADGIAQSHTIASGDIDWMRFTAETGKRYVATIKATPGMVYGYMIDGSGMQLTSQSGSQFSLVLQPTTAGNHYVRINPYSSQSTPYTVSLVAIDTSSSGFPVTFTTPDTVSTWAAGSIYTLNWTADPALFGTSISLALYQDNSLVRSITSGITNSGTYSWSIPVGFSTSSRYRIRISNYNNSAIWGYSGYFTISGLSPDSYEPDNTRPLSKTLTTDGIAQTRNITLNDTDWTAFDATVGKSYLISANSVSTVYLYVLDSLGTSLLNTSGTRPSLVFTPTRSGKYHARVQYYSAASAYQLSAFAFSSDGSGLDAKFIAPAESTTWATSTSYVASWTPDTARFGATVTLALYRDTTLIQSLISGISNVGSYSVSLTAGLASSNRYRLRLSNYAYPQIFGYSPYFTVSGLAPDSLEPNDTVGAAHEIAPNSGRRNLSLSSRDRDWFKFTGKAQRLYIIQTATPSNLYAATRLMNAAGTTQILSVSKSSSLDSLTSLSWVCPSDGIYSVVVEATSTSYYGNYGFDIKEIDPSSYQFTPSAPLTGSTLTKGISTNIAWTDPAGIKGYVDIFLYNSAGIVQTIIANASNTGTYSWLVPTTLPAGSDYYVKIISRTSDAVQGTSGVFGVGP